MSPSLIGKRTDLSSRANCACGDVDIWSRDGKRRPSRRNGRVIGERREVGGNMSEEMCEKVCM